jgi:hypothetical protein
MLLDAQPGQLSVLESFYRSPDTSCAVRTGLHLRQPSASVARWRGSAHSNRNYRGHEVYGSVGLAVSRSRWRRCFGLGLIGEFKRAHDKKLGAHLIGRHMGAWFRLGKTPVGRAEQGRNFTPSYTTALKNRDLTLLSA